MSGNRPRAFRGPRARRLSAGLGAARIAATALISTATLMGSAAMAGPARTAPLPMALPHPMARPAPLAATMVARLNHAGYKHKRHCTATLVARDLALTAAHCLGGVPLAEHHILPGYERGRADQNLRPNGRVLRFGARDVAAIAISPAHDGAVIRTVGEPQVGDTAWVQGYPMPAREIQTSLACPVLRVKPHHFLLKCTVAPGGSGAPVVHRTPGGPVLIGVISRRKGGATLAERLPPRLRAHIRAANQQRRQR
ncbi:trypsin-like peptidase domain-containing protein [Yunchengibacter salinarum]|uniref:trypsin-like peptidase domain-containing protein n=1 Tax=Yunchengibacter salinarum TaxID=3133399 RepID=UPI0035B63C67